MVRVKKRREKGRKTRDPRGFWMTLLLQGWEDCLEKGTRDVMSLENGPPCVHWRLERERETNSRRKKKKEATLSQIMEEGLCYSRSRGCKSFAIYGILSEKRLDKRPIKSLPAKSRPKSSTNPFPPPLPAFSLPRWIGGGYRTMRVGNPRFLGPPCSFVWA